MIKRLIIMTTSWDVLVRDALSMLLWHAVYCSVKGDFAMSLIFEEASYRYGSLRCAREGCSQYVIVISGLFFVEDEIVISLSDSGRGELS